MHFLPHRHCWRLLALFASVSLGSAAPVEYVREVKPILAETCYRCHGASQQKSGLRIDTAAFAVKGGESGSALRPGRGKESLIVQVLKGTHADIARMPYKKPPLSGDQITLIERWIDEGANAPADEAPEVTKHWAFISPVRSAPPRVKQSAWPRNGIDNFVLARLEKEGINPSPEADRVTLIRRVSLDLTGLPPSVAEVEAFQRDTNPDAYDRLVERLLASPHYGERWGRHWLDVARYADSNGYSIDAPRSIWKYRDWVINALNRDLPFDQFVIEQLAGDLLPNATLDQRIATGFHRNTQVNQEGGIDPEQFRIESVIDRVNTTGTTFLGLTIGCAQCHDHKFDPIKQREYYQLFAFFNNTIEDGHGKSAPEGMLDIPSETEPAENIQKEFEEAEADLDRILNQKGSELLKWHQAMSADARGRLKPEVVKAFERPFAEWTIKQKRIVFELYDGQNPEFKDRNARMTKLEKRQPKPITTLVMVERKEPRQSVIFIKGDFTRPGERVKPGVPEVLPPMRAVGTSPNRLDLAHWIVDRANPLTARVMVNRIWQKYFGHGLVETENDFGTQGSLPSHPELLDWLACELVDPSASGSAADPWSLKHIHRLIVTSAAYRQSSRVRPELAASDPNNNLLARQSRLRLDSEIVRDVCLSIGNLLSDRIGGPSVFPPQPNGVMALGQVKRVWNVSKGPDRYRRAMYTFLWRATPYPALAVFDSPDAFSTCTRRLRSNTPLQALTLLNDEAFYECAEGLATRVLREGPVADSDRMEFAFRLCLSRSPAEQEKRRLLSVLRDEAADLEKSSETSPKQLAAWTTISRVLLNLDETITRE